MITKLLILIEFNYGDVFFSAPICSATVGYGPNFERPNVFHATNVTQESCFVWIKWEKEKTVIGLSVQPSYFNQSNFETFLVSSTFLIFS